jgi:ribosomal protein S18 acetylase RimI-like enzyme
VQIGPLARPATAHDLDQLAGLLVHCVEAGASIGFLAPLPIADARAYWRGATADAEAGKRVVLVAREMVTAPIVGSAQLALEARPNGRHRAEIQKVIVHSGQRRRGIARLLMTAIEAAARERGVRLLYLDTSEGPGGARAFYDTLGYVYAGGIPGYALDPDGTPAKNAIYYKELSPVP